MFGVLTSPGTRMVGLKYRHLYVFAENDIEFKNPNDTPGRQTATVDSFYNMCSGWTESNNTMKKCT